MKCLIGIHPPTSGKIVFDGKEIRFKTTLEALNSGISMIHQELSPVPERSVSENLWLGRAPRKGLIIDHKKMRQDSIDLFREVSSKDKSLRIYAGLRHEIFNEFKKNRVIRDAVEWLDDHVG